MRKVCIISNYNYGDYLVDCIDSALSQIVKFDQIIIVDDGSTDNSRAVIKRYAQLSQTTIFPIFKSNGGQLSCFNIACRNIRNKDLVFFMDSDDIYPPNYTAEALKIISKSNSQFFFSKPITFHTQVDKPDDTQLSRVAPITILSSSQLTRLTKCWIGAPTSCIIVKGRLLKTILPYPFEENWRTRADDVIVYGASLAGCEKVFTPSIGIGYRIHKNNNFFGKIQNKKNKIIRQQHLEQLFDWYRLKFRLSNKITLCNCFSEHSAVPTSIRKYYFIPSKFKIILLYVKKLIFERFNR